MLTKKFIGFCLLIGLYCWPVLLHSQISEKVYQTDVKQDTTALKALLFELDNLNFFKNNEFKGEVVKGYSLPGLWIQPKLVYSPLEQLQLEAGFHALIYHGANKYPSLAYQDIATWKGNNYQREAHLLPYFRARIDLSNQLTLVFGNIYGGSNHRLIEPLYNPELNLTADPETGFQLLFSSKVFDFDAWLNWQSFIFRNDTHQEAFSVGLSSRLKYNNPNSKFHLYTPLQVALQHRGGEIDTITVNSISTLINGATGLGVDWNTGHRIFKKVNLECDMVAYAQQAGTLWPLDDGYGWYTSLTADIQDFRIKASHFVNRDFVSLFGSPFYGAVSLVEQNATFENPDMIYLGVEYSKDFGKGYALGVDLDFFHSMKTTLQHPTEGLIPQSANTSFSCGIYLRINPTILLKQF